MPATGRLEGTVRVCKFLYLKSPHLLLNLTVFAGPGHGGRRCRTGFLLAALTVAGGWHFCTHTHTILLYLGKNLCAHTSFNDLLTLIHIVNRFIFFIRDINLFINEPLVLNAP